MAFVIALILFAAVGYAIAGPLAAGIAAGMVLALWGLVASGSGAFGLFFFGVIILIGGAAWIWEIWNRQDKDRKNREWEAKRDADLKAASKPSGAHGSARWATKGDAIKAGIVDKHLPPPGEADDDSGPSTIPVGGVPLGYLRESLGPDTPPPVKASGPFASVIEDVLNAPAPLHYNSAGHGLIFASARSGKFVTMIAPFLIEDESSSAVVIDIKGECAGVCARRRRDMGHKVFILNPYHLHAEHFTAQGFTVTHQFNPLDTIDPQSRTFFDDCAKLAGALIRPDGDKAFFTDSARNLWTAFLMFVCLQPGETRTLPRVRRLIAELSNDEDREKHLISLKALGNDAIVNLSAILGGDSKALQDVLSTATTQTAFLDSAPITECLSASDFDFRELKRQKMTVFVILPESQMRLQSTWFRLVITAALGGVMDTPKKPDDLPVWMVLDEFAQLGHMDNIETALAMSAGLGLRMLFVLQDIPQLRNIYGNRWQSFESAAGFISIFGTNDTETADHFSKRAGQRTIKTVNASAGQVSVQQAEGGFTGINFGIGEAAQNLIEPEQLLDLRFDDQTGHGLGVVWVKGFGSPFAVDRWAYYKRKSLDGLHDENPCR